MSKTKPLPTVPFRRACNTLLAARGWTVHYTDYDLEVISLVLDKGADLAIHYRDGTHLILNGDNQNVPYTENCFIFTSRVGMDIKVSMSITPSIEMMLSRTEKIDT